MVVSLPVNWEELLCRYSKVIWRRIAESTWALKSTEGGATPKVAKATEADFIIEWIADELVSTYNYPIDWLGTRIVRADWHDKPRGQNLMGLNRLLTMASQTPS